MQLQSNSGYRDIALPYHNLPLHYNFKHLAGEKCRTHRPCAQAIQPCSVTSLGAGGEAGAQVSASLLQLGAGSERHRRGSASLGPPRSFLDTKCHFPVTLPKLSSFHPSTCPWAVFKTNQPPCAKHPARAPRSTTTGHTGWGNPSPTPLHLPFQKTPPRLAPHTQQCQSPRRAARHQPCPCPPRSLLPPGCTCRRGRRWSGPAARPPAPGPATISRPSPGALPPPLVPGGWRAAAKGLPPPPPCPPLPPVAPVPGCHSAAGGRPAASLAPSLLSLPFPSSPLLSSPAAPGGPGRPRGLVAGAPHSLDPAVHGCIAGPGRHGGRRGGTGGRAAPAPLPPWAPGAAQRGGGRRPMAAPLRCAALPRLGPRLRRGAAAPPPPPGSQFLLRRLRHLLAARKGPAAAAPEPQGPGLLRRRAPEQPGGRPAGPGQPLPAALSATGVSRQAGSIAPAGQCVPLAALFNMWWRSEGFSC